MCLVVFRLVRVRLGNIFSFKDAELELGRLNVVVGPNASGKSNLVGVFRFLRRALGSRVEPSLPYLPWWSARNIAFDFDEELPVKVGLDLEYDGKSGEKPIRVSFDLVFSVAGGRVELVEERLEIHGFSSIYRRKQFLHVENRLSESEANAAANVLSGTVSDSELIDYDKVEDFLEEFFKVFKSMLNSYVLSGDFVEPPKSPSDSVILRMIPYEFFNIFPGGEIGEVDIGFLPEIVRMILMRRIRRLDKSIARDMFFAMKPLYVPSEKFIEELKRYLVGLFTRPVILRPVNYVAVREPVAPILVEGLKEDCSNLVAFLYDLFLRHRDKWEELQQLLDTYFFPGWRLAFKPTGTGKVTLVVYEFDREIPPTNLPEGLFKVLAVLVAILLEPPLIVIDEFENSLHPNFVEVLLDMLRDSGATCIVTTHSPAVVDAAELDEIVVVERGPEGSKFSRVHDREGVKKWLRETGASVSEYVFYR